jgi:hypothetical protein
MKWRSDVEGVEGVEASVQYGAREMLIEQHFADL